ncbi:hypothetical protein [Bacillus sp. GM1]|uniref:hypothetical protein n=1 Tax=Bacillus sp. GM1 TaxID=796348 RepID=UPI003F91B6D1
MHNEQMAGLVKVEGGEPLFIDVDPRLLSAVAFLGHALASDEAVESITEVYWAHGTNLDFNDALQHLEMGFCDCSKYHSFYCSPPPFIKSFSCSDEIQGSVNQLK